MAIDTEREIESETPADGGLTRLDLPGTEPAQDDEPLADEELETA
jgi:hypothetical protein